MLESAIGDKKNMSSSKKGYSFEQKVYENILDAINPHKKGDLLNYCFKHSAKETPDYSFSHKGNEYYILRNKMIGGHEIDIALVDEKMLNLIESNADESRIGNRDEGYFFAIECKNYEHNIKAKFGTDLLAKNYFLNPNYSMIIKGKNEGDFNWKGNFRLACAKMQEYCEKTGLKILDELGKTNETPKSHDKVFNAINFILYDYIKEKRLYESDSLDYSDKTSLEFLLMKNIPFYKMKKNLKNFPPFPNAKDKIVIDYPAIAISKDKIIFSKKIKENVTLPIARHLMGYCLMAKAKEAIYYNGAITGHAEKYFNIHKDMITAIKISIQSDE